MLSKMTLNDDKGTYLTESKLTEIKRYITKIHILVLIVPLQNKYS